MLMVKFDIIEANRLTRQGWFSSLLRCKTTFPGAQRLLVKAITYRCRILTSRQSPASYWKAMYMYLHEAVVGGHHLYKRVWSDPLSHMAYVI